MVITIQTLIRSVPYVSVLRHVNINRIAGLQQLGEFFLHFESTSIRESGTICSQHRCHSVLLRGILERWKDGFVSNYLHQYGLLCKAA